MYFSGGIILVHDQSGQEADQVESQARKKR
jgi:hypothetical protein